MILRKVLSKYQITLPKEIVRMFHIERGDLLRCEVENRRIVLSLVQVSSREGADALLDQISRKWERLGITDRDIETAVQWARKR